MKCTLKDLEYGEKTENHGKWEIHTLEREIWRGKLKKVENLEMSTVGLGVWQENRKSWKLETFTGRLEQWRNHWKSWKMRNAHCKTWNIARNLKIMENVKNPLNNLKNEITEKLEKWEIHTVRHGKRRENWKSRKMRNTHFRK